MLTETLFDDFKISSYDLSYYVFMKIMINNYYY